MIQKLSHTTLYVIDQDRAKAFYTDKLGFEARSDQSMGNFRWLTVAPKGQAEPEIVLVSISQSPSLDDESSNTRYMFYLAQSYRDSHQNQQAEHCYRKRAEMGGWEGEDWYSLYQIGILRERMNRPAADVLEAHLAAYDFRPRRAEPLVALGGYFRARDVFGRALAFGKAALDLRPLLKSSRTGCAARSARRSRWPSAPPAPRARVASNP